MQRKPIAIWISAGALAFALTGVASAQNAGSSSAPSGTSNQAATNQQGGMTAQRSQPNFSNLYKASNLNGLMVKDAQGEDFGKITDVLIGSNGQVEEVVVSSGGFFGAGGRHYAIPWNELQINPQQKSVSINLSKQQITSEFSAFTSLPPTRLEQRAQPSQTQQQDQQQNTMQEQQPSGQQQPSAGQ